MKLRRIVSCMMALLLVAGMPLAAFAEEYDLSVGSVEVNASETGQTVSQVNGVQNHTETTPTVITQSNSSTPTENTVTITATENATANVTIQDVNIDTGTSDGAAIQTTGDGDVTIELDGSNTVQSGDYHAGVEKYNGGNLTITDENGTSGSLKATGGGRGAGIGNGFSADASNITISGSAEVIAKGGGSGAGIGGGEFGSGTNIIITDSAKVDATGGDRGSGIGGGYYGSGNNITITDSAEVTAKGDNYGSGIGGGYNGSGSYITISGSAEVTAKGGDAGSGIGGGARGFGSNITVSGDAQVKAQGGIESDGYGAGAAIGDGGKYNYGSEADPGDDVTPNIEGLNEGWIAKYAPGATMDTDAPNSVAYMDDGQLTTSSNAVPILKKEPTCTGEGNKAGFEINGKRFAAETIPATGHSFTNYISDNNATYDADGTKTAKCDHCDATDTIPDPGSKLVREAPLYRVLGQDGKALACKEARSSGVLTITVEADFATLTGSFSGMKTLKAQGVDTIVFVTGGATSTFAIADLLAQGSSTDTYALTHVGSAVTLTLGNGIDISSILK